ncbi:hypothetical protein ODS41_04005 [Pyrobaculum sp. 3827-6]|uniref:hypothetical protein n=1 Tax=Pyrobaculum sp. 3827-6 TaxID=2983604 RepID=UPI0021DA7E7A|nr:hypothetical protein [Pyrobaculum sp. 3827-6]MCU7787092.1 hypothetical protein [Pyrobaculum sp. 3827-6]
MAGRVSITVSTPYMVDSLYRRIVGELRAMSRWVEIHVEGNRITIPLVEGVYDAVWRIIKTSPSVVVTSVDFK